MSTSHRLRIDDVTAVCRLVDDCRHLAADPRAWQGRMLGELCRITGCQIANCGEVVPRVDSLDSDLSTLHDAGWQTQRDRQRVLEFHTSGEFLKDEFCLRLARKHGAAPSRQTTFFRRQLIDDGVWARSDTRDAYRTMGLSDVMMSLVPIDRSERVLAIGLMRVVGERPVGCREAQVLELFCQLLAPHLGRTLPRIGEPGIAELSPRRRQVLAGLLDGLSEKQIAAQLGLRLPTVHEYVTWLHRHFRVTSRAELLALFLRRQCGPAHEWIRQFAPS